MVTVLMMNMRLPSKFPPAIFPPAIFTPGQVQLVAHWMISVFIFGFRFYDDHPRTQITERQGLGMYFTRWELRGGIKKIKLFFLVYPKGGGRVSPNPKFPYQKKLRFFLIFSLIPKGFYHKILIFRCDLYCSLSE